MVSKKRIKLSRSQKTAILFDSDTRCCICRDRNKKVQIHHIDGDPANNNANNLAVLCLEHHNDVSSKGGFGCSWSPDLIKKYRDDWLQLVNSNRDKHFQPSFPENFKGIDTHNAFLDALACHEIIKLEPEILHAKWEEIIPLLENLYTYTSYDYGIPPRAKIIDVLHSLSGKTWMAMPVDVVQRIESLVHYSLPIITLVAPERRVPTKEQVNVLTSANCVGYTITSDGVRRLKNIKIVAAGVQIMSTVLRYAKLNKLGNLYKSVINDFKIIVDLASKTDFPDAVKWLTFKQADALAIKDKKLPTIPIDVEKKIMA